jgi:hypothetical protein
MSQAIPLIRITSDRGFLTEQEFDVTPRVGDIIHVSVGNEVFDLLIDIAHHFHDFASGRMRYSVHGTIIKDLPAELKQRNAVMRA